MLQTADIFKGHWLFPTVNLRLKAKQTRTKYYDEK